MCLFKFITIYSISIAIIATLCQSETTSAEFEDDSTDMSIADELSELIPQKKVNVKLYYESLCPYCREFGQRLKIYANILEEYIDLQLYPYGNAETEFKYGNYVFDCQHGEDECYGNRLHACAIDILGNITQAVNYTSCMMDPAREDDYGSNDAAADECAAQMSLDSGPIKNCAKSSKGIQLLKYYGDETDKANIEGVPHILIDGKESNSETFVDDLTEAIANNIVEEVINNGTEATTPVVEVVNSSRNLHSTNICLPIAMTLILLHISLKWLR